MSIQLHNTLDKVGHSEWAHEQYSTDTIVRKKSFFRKAFFRNINWVKNVVEKKCSKNTKNNYQLAELFKSSFRKQSLRELKCVFIFQKISMFDQDSDFWPKWRFLTKIPIFDQNSDFWPKFGFLTKIWIFDQNLDFWTKFGFLIEVYIFWNNLALNWPWIVLGKLKPIWPFNILLISVFRRSLGIGKIYYFIGFEKKRNFCQKSQFCWKIKIW